MRLNVTLALLLAVVAGAAAGPAPPLSAHALLLRAEPPVNATLQQPPREIALYFSEPLERRFSAVSVVDQDGARPEQTLHFDDADGTLMTLLLGPTGPGFLVVSWETVSVVDGHRISGSFPITILNPDGSLPAATPPAPVSASGAAAQADLAVVKFLQFVAGCLLVGALLFMLSAAVAFRGDAGPAARLASDRRCLLAALAALVVIAAAAGLELALQASNIGSSLGDVLSTRWGERWLLRHALLAVSLAAVIALLLASPRRRPGLAAAALVAAVAALATTSSTSHAAAGAGSVWATAIDFVHLFAASVWIGMLAMLASLFFWATRRPDPAVRAVLETGVQRFSSIAVVSLSLMFLTGVWSAGIEVARLDDLIDTGYGRTLLVKLLLVAPLLGVAAYNAYVLRPRFLAPAGAAASNRDERPRLLQRRFARTIGLELALALAVLAVAAVLVQTTPTRGATAGAVASGAISETKQVEGLGVTLTVDPGRPGFNAFEVNLAGAASLVEQVRLEFFDRSGATSESRLELEATGLAYTGSGPFLDKAGEWQVRVNLRQSQGSDLSIPFDLTVETAGAGDARGGAFDPPVALTATRILIAVLAALLAAALVFASLRGGARHGGYAGALLRRLRLFDAERN